MFDCRILDDIGQLKKIYKILMKKDFPPSELKPFSIIKKEIERSEYVCYGMFDDDVLCGYAFFVVRNAENGVKNYLLDYFAVTEADRNKGIGSAFLGLISEKLSGSGIIICEAENPDFAEDTDEKNLRERRIGFYIRNGFSDTGVTVRLFGVEYVILEITRNEKHSQDEIKEFYYEVYSRIVPKLLLKKNFVIH